MLLVPALAADAQPVLTGLLDRFHGDDAGGDGDDPEAQQHHHRRQQLPLHRLGHEVAVAHRGHGDDRPVHPLPHGLELGVGVTALKATIR